MDLTVFRNNGVPAERTVALDDSVFGIEPNDHVLWLDVRRTQAAARQGTHKTKERSEVAGSTRKLYRQKGTGMARSGSIKSPLRRRGGRTFGPRPRAYVIRLSKKTRQLARRSALSYKAQGDAIRVVEELSFEEPDTRQLINLITTLALEKKQVLIVTAASSVPLHKSSRNIARVAVKEARNLSAEDILRAGVLVCEEEAIHVLTNSLGSRQAA